ncbi:MAG: M23 family metallopeptidase [Pseudomonadota bacterium]
MTARFIGRVHAALERRLPEQRLFLKSEDGTRFVRLRPVTQAMILGGSALFVGWTVIVTSFFLIDSLGADNARETAAREQQLYLERLNYLSAERDARTDEAMRSQDRFALAMDQVAEMQVRLLASEERRRELETAVDVIQGTLRDTILERDMARAEVADMRTEMTAELGSPQTVASQMRDMSRTIAFLTEALETTAGQRDHGATMVAEAATEIDRLQFEAALQQERQERVFRQIEDAVAVSMEPLDRMFSSAGLSTDQIIGSVRSAYDGQGGPLMPITMSSSGEEPDAMSLRANEVLAALDEMNVRRIAAEQLPFTMPVAGSYRFTSGFGYRRDPFNGSRRLHAGADFAGSRGTPIVAGADGVVIATGRQRGYGLMVEIRHSQGFTTRYAHLSRIRVSEGERVSRGEQIGDMGNTGRSTGTHLHYEVRRNGTPVDPMTFITAGRDVF